MFTIFKALRMKKLIISVSFGLSMSTTLLCMPATSNTIPEPKRADSCSTDNLQKHQKIISKLFKSAIKTNPSINKSYQTYLANKKLEQADIASYFPSLSASAKYLLPTNDYGNSVNWDPDLLEYSSSNYYYNYSYSPNISLEISMPILDLVKVFSTKQLKDNSYSLDYAYQGTLKDIMQQTLNNYIDFQLLIENTSIAEGIVDEFELITSTQKALLEEGFANMLDYVIQNNTLLTSKAKLAARKKDLENAISQIKYLTSIHLKLDQDFVPLPSPLCIPKVQSLEILNASAEKNYEKLSELRWRLKSLSNQANAALSTYAPKLKAGYSLSYFEQNGNINGYSKYGEKYSNFTGSPYISVEMKFNLAGGDYLQYQSILLQKESIKSAISETAEQVSNSMQHSINATNTSRDNFSIYAKQYETSKQAISVLKYAVDTGFVEASAFNQLQNSYFASVSSAAKELGYLLKAYVNINRLSGETGESSFPFKLYLPQEAQ